MPKPTSITWACPECGRIHTQRLVVGQEARLHCPVCQHTTYVMLSAHSTTAAEPT